MAREYTLGPQTQGSGSKIDFESELNPEQYSAVTSSPGRSLVIAGAGSGKTRTLVYRVAYLLLQGVAPEEILLLTFTNKAAKEMMDRVGELVPFDSRRMWGGTFHSVGNRFLRLHADRLGYKSGFSIMDREDTKDLLHSVIASLEIDVKETRFPKPAVLAEIFSLVVNTDQSIEQILAEKYQYFDQLLPQVEEVMEAYKKRKKSTNCVDFDDLLNLPLQLFRNNQDLRGLYQTKFRHILVDEYQDTNSIQSELIDLMAGDGSLMVVGDDAQSIYSWRGANFENILKFPKQKEDTLEFRIETNYRSSPEILNLANASISGNEKQFPKNLKAARKSEGFKPAFVRVPESGSQAAFVAQRILELRDEGIELNEIAVLYRAHYQSMETQMEFTKRNIPFDITSGLRFFEQAHIKDVAAFLRFASNRSDEVSFVRMIRLLPGVGNVSASKLWNAWRKIHEDELKGELPNSFSDVLSAMKPPKRSIGIWEQLGYTLDEFLIEGEEGMELVPPSMMIASVVGGVYEDILKASYENYESRKQDLDQLSFYGQNFESIEEFLSQLALLSGVDAGPQQQKDDDDEQVILSSVHQAKGLEWKAVFVLWCCEGMFPLGRVVEDGNDEDMEEERRLFYVAATRAKDELYLMYPELWHGSHTGDVMQRPSRFIEEIPDDLMEEWKVGGFY